MKFGVCLDCDGDIETFIDRVQKLEQLGFDSLWLTDLGLESLDVFVFMSVAGLHSRRLRIGAGVHPPQLRSCAVTLNALVSIEAFCAGRVFFALGTGAPRLVNAVGRRPLKLRELRELLNLVPRLFAGDTVSSCAEELRMNSVRLSRLPHEPLPVFLAATGPKTLSLGAELADGVLAHVGADAATLQLAQRSCEHGLAGRQCSTPFELIPYLYTSIAADREQAVEACARGARTIVYRAPHLAAALGCDEQQVERLRRGDPDGDDILTRELVSKLTLAGTVSDCIEKLEAMNDIGIEHTVLLLKGDDLNGQIEQFGREILPRFS